MSAPIYANLNKNNRADVDVISGNASKSKFRLVGRFSPHANPDYKPQAGESELNTVIATDVLSEGLNMQDCDTIINYDLHWNPVRLIQRFGRIDRIGSTHNKVFGLNFLPEDALDKNLGLKDRLKRRIAEIQETIGEDSAILDPAEKVNQEAMYAIYDNEPSNLDLFEPDEPMGLGEAEGILRKLRAEDPAEFERIASLRDGIRSGMNSLRPGIFVLCQAGDFQQLFFVDPAGQIETRDAGTILARIKCTPSTPALAIPANYNAAVMKVYQTFSEEVAHRKTALEHSTALSAGQRYIAQELKPFSEGLDEADPRRTDIEILQRTYGSHSLTAAVQTELRRIRNHKLTGESLFTRLRDVYDQHHLSQLQDQSRRDRQVAIPRNHLTAERLTDRPMVALATAYHGGLRGEPHQTRNRINRHGVSDAVLLGRLHLAVHENLKFTMGMLVMVVVVLPFQKLVLLATRLRRDLGAAHLRALWDVSRLTGQEGETPCRLNRPSPSSAPSATQPPAASPRTAASTPPSESPSSQTATSRPFTTT
jgi:hypothetical protein